MTYAATLSAGAALAGFLLKDDATPWAAPFAALWWIAVLVVIRSDLKHFIIPDGASFLIALLGLVYAAVAPWQMGFGATQILADTAAAALGGGCGFAVFWLVARSYRRVRGRDGLGFGDVKLAGALAIWLSPADAALALQTAAVAGLLVLLWRRHLGSSLATFASSFQTFTSREGAHSEAVVVADTLEPDGETALPFGAFMAPAAWLAFVAGPLLHHLMDGAG